MMQKIRNRISAQESRDRRKVYIETIEQENKILKQENQVLRDTLKKIKNENTILKEEREQILKQKDQISTTQEETESIDNSNTDNTTAHQKQPNQSITRQRLGSPGMDWKVGTLFVLCMVCASTMIPNNSISSEIKNVKTNSIVPLNLLNPGNANSGAKTATTNQQVFKQSRMNDLCAPYCKNQCAKNEQEMYQKYYETARKVHEFIPSLYGPKRDLYNTNEDNAALDVIDFLDLNTNTNNSDDKIIQEDVMSPVGATNNANA